MEILKARVAEILYNNGYEPAEIDYNVRFLAEPSIISFRINYWERLGTTAWAQIMEMDNVLIEQTVLEDDDCLPEYFYEVKYK